MKTKNNTFFDFLDKMQIFTILCLVTYDWFCADGSHISILTLFAIYIHPYMICYLSLY